MNRGITIGLTAVAAFVAASAARAYPGGTPDFQTDVAPFCAACHASLGPEAMAGAGERAEKEVAERKHIAVILAGEKGYEKLGEEDRKALAEQIRALDTASSVAIDAPDKVQAGAEFEVTVSVTGGAGPVVGVGLVDRDHRWYARPAASAGWQVVAPPKIIGGDGTPQSDWILKRPEAAGRNLSYVNVKGISSDAVAKRWASARVVFTLRAPDRPGAYPLAAVYFYGTEKATPLGYTTNAVGWKEVRGGFTGNSGRVLFTTVKQVQVEKGASAASSR